VRRLQRAAVPRVTEVYTRLSCRRTALRQYKTIDAASLNAEQRQSPQRNAIRNFVLSGYLAGLVGEAKRLADIQSRQARLSQKFSENALDATGFACTLRLMS
jgi:oligopeptidase A